MKYTILRSTDLTQEQADVWRGIQTSNPSLSSPYFCEQFITSVAEVRKDVYITLIEDAGEVIGFFPYQRSPLGFGRPVGGPLSDYHGLIMRSDRNISMEELLRRSRLVSWEFNHLPAAQTTFASYAYRLSSSPAIDLSGGLHEYYMDLERSGTQIKKKLEYYLRRLCNDCGEVSISHESTNPEELDTLLRWKSEQYARSGLVDVFSVAWTRNLLKVLMRHRSDEFGGVLSVLKANGRLIAAHFGMRTTNTWHWWFPSYDMAFAKYSPGMVLLADAMKTAVELGIRPIDLGKGEAEYKTRLSNSRFPLAEGEAWLRSFRINARTSYRQTKDAIRKSRAYSLIKGPMQALGRAERNRRFS